MFSLPVRRPSWSAGEWEARRAAAWAARGGAVPEIEAVPEETGLPPSHTQEALGSPGQPLDARVRADLEPRFGHDFSRVRVHADAGAAQSASALGARAYTFGQDIVFGPGRYEPASPSGRSLIAHELAHVVQQGRAGRAALQLSSELDSLPLEERKKIQVLTETLSAGLRDDLEQAYLDATPPKLPADLTVQFGASVAKPSRDGLNAVVGVLAERQPPNTSITLAISAAGGVYRFTRVERSSKKKKTSVMVVERTGEIGAAAKEPLWEAFPGPFPTAQGPLPAAEARRMDDCSDKGATLDWCRDQILGKPVTEGPFEVRGVKLNLGSGWKPRDTTALLHALGNLPDTVLDRARGYTFDREEKKICTDEAVKAEKCSPDTDAETSIATGHITLFDLAFRESTTRTGTSTLLESTLIHEIGHIADMVLLGNAMYRYRRSPLGEEDKKKVMASRSLSDLGWSENSVLKQGDVIEFMDPGETPQKDSFRAAAMKDGLVLKDGKIVAGGITSYGQKGWGELFAESYMIYFSDPDLLKAIRPNVYKYFAAAWPQKKKK